MEVFGGIGGVAGGQMATAATSHLQLSLQTRTRLIDFPSPHYIFGQFIPTGSYSLFIFPGGLCPPDLSLGRTGGKAIFCSFLCFIFDLL